MSIWFVHELFVFFSSFILCALFFLVFYILCLSCFTGALVTLACGWLLISILIINVVDRTVCL